MRSDPLVSVIIPAFNAQAYIAETLESLLAQTYQNFEVIVVDDGSSDRTSEIVESFVQRDERIRLLKQQNAGCGNARNTALQESKGEYIAPIDADDIWFPEKLGKQVKCLEESDPSVGLVYSWSVYLNASTEVIGFSPFAQFGRVEGNVFNFLVFYNFLDNASTMMYRRSCLDRVGIYDRSLRTCEDWDLYLRIAEHYQFRIVPEYLIGYRQYLGSISTNCTTMAHFYEHVMSQAYQRHPELPDYVRRWANTAFYNNLLGKSYRAGDDLSVFRWIYRILKGDLALLLRPGIYKVILVSSLRLGLRSLLSLVGKDQQTWNPLKQRLQPRSTQATATQPTAQLPKIDLQQPITEVPESQTFWKPYDLVILRRWKHMIQTT